MRQVNRRIEQGVLRLHRDVTVQVATNLAQDTPVDTGQAKSNWVTSVGSAYGAYIGPYVPGRFGSTAGANINAAISQAQHAAAMIQIGDTSYVTNNAPYIERLNQGYSLQAPSGFVERSILQAVETIASRRFI